MDRTATPHRAEDRGSGLGTLSPLLQEKERARQVSCALPDDNCGAAASIFDILMMPALWRTTDWLFSGS
jgi:hypothetical protein